MPDAYAVGHYFRQRQANMDIHSSHVSIRSGTHGRTPLARLRELLKLGWRSALDPHATHGWLGLLNSDPVFRQLVAARPRLVGKVFRPYLSTTLNSAQRTSLLIGHYHSILRQGWGPLVLQAAGAGVELGALPGKRGGVIRLVLRAVEPMEREGELALQLMHDAVLVCSCAFVLIDSPDGFDVGVGCIQGPGGGAGLSIVREATRQLHGLRPKSLLIKLLCVLGRRYGCDGLRLVGNGNRTVRGAIRQGKVHADYDAFWRECGATRRDDGDYYLRCAALAPPDLLAMASSKRSGARHRHEVLRQLAGLVSARLDREGGPAGPT
ncbi:DUF535 family protein [Burkholderia sp. LMU1-1-1.1]|uniref:DUF535 family protein n=1 Tax=Burkholderia sp. LMU1-1-1.1 TaxID=3135266 RepID=UPI0034307069